MADDNFDDNRDDSCAAQYRSYSPKSRLSCLVTLRPAPGSVGVRSRVPLAPQEKPLAYSPGLFANRI
jgi:hypothetical protein